MSMIIDVLNTALLVSTGLLSYWLITTQGQLGIAAAAMALLPVQAQAVTGAIPFNGTVADTCTITEELKKSGLRVNIRPRHCVLKKNGGGTIEHVGSVALNVTFRDRSMLADFKVVKAPGCPSIFGCRQAIELGVVSIK